MSRRVTSHSRMPAKPRSEDARPAPVAGAVAWPRASELLDPRAPWLFPGLAVVITRLLLWRAIPYAAEDAYITFRYARNLAHGFGWVYNPGERVFGFSSPLWTAWMALGFRLEVPPVLWARITTLIAEIFLLVAVVALLRRHASQAAAWCFALFFALWPYFSAVSVSCMENTVMAALMALAALWSERRSLLSGPALAAVFLIRPEGAAAALALMLTARWRDRLIGASIAVAGVIGLWLYFGSPLPQSVLAKSQLYGTPGPLAAPYWWDWLVPMVFGRFSSVNETTHLFLMSVALAPAMVLGARALWPRGWTGLAALILACFAVWLGYALFGVAFFWWYLVVPLIGFAALAAVGFPRLARGAGLYVSIGLFITSFWTIGWQLYIGRAQAEYAGFAEVANFLQAQAVPGQKVFLEPIGMVGFEAPLIVVDEIGLVSPHVARRRLQGPGWYTDVVSTERPDWLVVRRGMILQGRSFAGRGAPFRSDEERDALLRRYTLVSRADTTAGANTLWVMRRL
jgi:hypothetical protein